MFGVIGTSEMLIVFAVGLLIFGGAKLPALARSLGQAQKEFKQGLSEGATSTDDDTSSAARDDA